MMPVHTDYPSEETMKRLLRLLSMLVICALIAAALAAVADGMLGRYRCAAKNEH